ncbi:MAG: DUF1592 domain-containing protein [Verrucomicrobiales bacterium]|nr:DUF1592 domain-containing protein [Verrucomicrobiales bacterium]
MERVFLDSLRVFVIVVFLCLLFSPPAAAEMDAAVRAVLKEHCYSCHGPEKQKSDIRFDTLPTDLIQERAAAETWHDALNALHLGEMPPEDEPPLSQEGRALLTGWIQGQIDLAISEMESTGGRAVVRRLNRSEYQDTMVDLLGLDLDYISNLPPDSVSPEGFKNNGAVLSMSPMQLEYYLEAARKGLQSAIVTSGRPEVSLHSSEETVADKGKGNYTNRLGRVGSFVARIPGFPDEGEFEMRIRARAELVEGKGFPRMKVRFGYRADTQAPAEDVAIVDVTSDEAREFVFRGRMESFPIQSRSQSKYPGMLTWISNVYKDGEEFQSLQKVTDTNAKGKKKTKQVYVEDPNFPKVVIESFSFTAPVFSSWPPEPHRRILFESSLREENEEAYAREVVARFAKRAFRRPVEAVEVEFLMRFYRKVRPTVKRFELAMREVLAMTLISPDFLYLIEPGEEEKRSLNEFELASRLSYFLWNTMPDERLIRLAESGDLRKQEVLRQETGRLLDDPRSDRFVEQFASQWLDLSSVDRIAVNPEYYEDFDTSLKPHMQAETRAFFSEVLRKDLSALNFIDSDFVMLNEPMARHYGVEGGPGGTTFERVKLAEGIRRGGLLTQASILLGNSTGEDSHPILRAVWLRNQLLDDPPAPPPPNVPELDGESPDMAKLPVREQLEHHREDPSCADCHRGIDPWGIAMENYDAIGQWREKIRRKDPQSKKREVWYELPIEADAELPDGEMVEGMVGLKSYLLKKRKDQFGRALVSRLSSYALGRSLELTDQADVDEISSDFSKNDFRLRYLISKIVSSELFHTK